MKYLRRLVWYIASRLLVLCCVLGLMTIAFYFAMNATNIYIVVKEGMAKRAQVVMMDEDSAPLYNYFSRSYLELDETLLQALANTSPYENYDITGIDHRVTMQWMWCWPWEDTARAEIIESVPGIDGRVKASQREAVLAQGGQEALSPPKWRTCRYRVTLIRENSQWRIRNLTLLEVLEE